MVLVVPGTARFSVIQTCAGRPAVNVLDYFLDTTGALTDREEACFRQAGALINAWRNNISTRQSSNTSLLQVNWVDLDEADGSTGSRTETSEGALPKVGEGEAAGLPPNVAVLVKKQAGTGRGARSGRMYIIGAGESETSTSAINRLGSGQVAAWQTVMEDFLEESTSEDAGVLDYQSHMVVVHDNGVATPNQTSVTALVVDALLATQRRRLRG